MPVVKKSWGGMATMQSTRSASIMFPRPPVLEDSEPLAITKPAIPPPRLFGGARWWMKC
jgi:hypothetical protein